MHRISDTQGAVSIKKQLNEKFYQIKKKSQTMLKSTQLHVVCTFLHEQGYSALEYFALIKIKLFDLTTASANFQTKNTGQQNKFLNLIFFLLALLNILVFVSLT